MLLVQFKRADGARQVGILGDAGEIAVLDQVATTYELAQRAIAAGKGLVALADELRGTQSEAFSAVAGSGRLLAPLDHPDSAHCLVSGTGLTHLGSADARDAMHQKVAGDVAALTDSMKMFRMGLENGKPAAGQVGAQPEWFYKGDGSIVRASGADLSMPAFSQDGGEEPEVAALYLNGADGTPHRLGFALGNEFSDHITERHNYLWLAHSKLRQCSVGPALRVGELPEQVSGTSRVLDRDGQVRWSKPFLSGEANMSHTLANLEHHHFKYPLFRQPGDVHIHFFGTATLSFADGISVLPGETFEIEAPGFGPALSNRLAIDASPESTTTRIHAL